MSKKHRAARAEIPGRNTAASPPAGSSGSPPREPRRVAVVAGLRTPFVRRGAAFRALSALDLGKIVVAELLARVDLQPREVELCVFGQALPSVTPSNLGRAIVLGSGMPRGVQAFTVDRACASSLQAMTSAAEAMLAEQCEVAVVGGADSASAMPVTMSRRLALAMHDAARARTLAERLKIFARLSPRDLFPSSPWLVEPSMGLTLGEAVERMAKEAGISREEQDAFAHRSHTRAAAAQDAGVFSEEVMHVVPPPSFEAAVADDDVVRRVASLEAFGDLAPAFDPHYGTITEGNSSPHADGASALVLMTEARAGALGYKPLGYLRSWAYAALDPDGWTLMGPAYAAPRALDRAGLRLADMDVIELHEAFAAQVLCNANMLASPRFATDTLGRADAVGVLDFAKLNVHGGSIAFGHPVAATGTRMIHSALRELRRRGGQFALVTTCASGGLGAAVVLEAAA